MKLHNYVKNTQEAEQELEKEMSFLKLPNQLQEVYQEMNLEIY